MNFSPIIPFEPISTHDFVQGEQWISQVKWDGVRILVYFDGNEVKLFNRSLNDRTLQYGELTNITHYCSAQSVILDGEVIALKEGKPSFHQIMKRDSRRKESSVQIAMKQIPITYMIFDILYLNGQWVTERELQERQNLLRNVITPTPYVQLVDNHTEPNSLYEAAVHFGLEGIMMKDLTSQYAIGGKDKRWQKKKVFLDLIAAVGGVTYRAGTVNALLLGLYDDQGRFCYIGHVGTGKLTHKDWRDLTQVVDDLKIPETPFFNLPSRSKEAVWIKPALAVKVKFLEWTPQKSLRQPSIQSFVDIDVRKCTLNQS